MKKMEDLANSSGNHLLAAFIGRRRLGISLLLTGIILILLFAAVLYFSMQTAESAGSCRHGVAMESTSNLEILRCASRHAQARDRGILVVPVAIAGGGLVAAGAAALIAPVLMRRPQRASEADWESFAPRAELDLGPALNR